MMLGIYIKKDAVDADVQRRQNDVQRKLALDVGREALDIESISLDLAATSDLFSVIFAYILTILKIMLTLTLRQTLYSRVKGGLK